MEYSKGEVIISPKIIYWVQPPVSLGENDRIELLKRDVLLINFDSNIKDLVQLKEKDNPYSGYLFNLDGILQRNHIKLNAVYPFIEKLAKFINAVMKKRSLIYTTILDKKIDEVFKKYGLIFLEKNLNDKKIAITAIFNLIHPFFAQNNKVERSFVRLNLLPMRYKVTITNLTRNNIVVNGIIKDLSLNGMGFVVIDENKIDAINLKDILEVKASIKNSIIKISKGIVSRVDQKKFEIGIMYNITDKNMIREDYASFLTGIIYNWIKDIIKEHGEIKTD